MLPLLHPRRPRSSREQDGQDAELAREDVMTLQEDDEWTAVIGRQRPAGDGAALLLEEFVGDLNVHEPVEPVRAGEVGPIGGLADAAKAAGPARPESANFIGPAHR